MKPIPVLSRIHPAGLALADQALVSGTNFLHLIAAARCLSVEDFGMFSLAWAVLQCAGSIHTSLVLQPLVVLFPEYSQAVARRYLVRLEHLHLGLFLLLLPGGIAALVLPTLAPLILATVGIIIFRLGAEHERRVAYVLADGPRACALDTATYLPLFLLTGWWWWHPWPATPDLLIWPATGSAALGWLAGRILLRPARMASSHDAQPPAIAREHWAFGKWVLLNALSSYIGNQIYPFLLAGYLGLREVAALAAARSVIGATHVVLMGFSAYGTPKARQQFVQQGWPGLRAAMAGMSLITAMLVLPFLVACAIWPQAILTAFLGPAYADCAWIFRWFAGLYLLIAINALLSMTLQALKEPRAGSLAAGLAAIITLCAGPWIVQQGGIQGVLLAMIGNAALFLLIAVWWIRRTARQVS